ncbi:predicted protein [Histoplasma mississippiense (nom. inval.)]|uniref:predicted protein n=1 Tax=Ajellomyces capsulatus (strain NAm1 / WU24) TaxID=2059318 RepID=UPI000157BFD3|nr:predicted protein [Histoplasma mississippiense (nom. inval.)]EDN06830.1 predicted protein [Histoplasma mississippiense (nom. inval.)]
MSRKLQNKVSQKLGVIVQQGWGMTEVTSAAMHVPSEIQVTSPLRAGMGFGSSIAKELIKINALQVAPAELEAALLEHDDIADAAVVGQSIAKGVDACRIGMSRPLPHAMRRTATILPCFRGAPRYSTRACGNTGRTSRITIYSLSSAPTPTMLTTVSLRSCRQTRDFSSTSQTELPKADDYIQELQDLSLEIAAESTAAETIYAVSDRISLREAFDDLDHAYSAYIGTTPHPSRLERPANAGLTGKEDGAKVFGEGGEGGEGDGERPNGRSMNFNPEEVRDDVREEIKKRIGQRIRELRNAQLL